MSIVMMFTESTVRNSETNLAHARQACPAPGRIPSHHTCIHASMHIRAKAAHQPPRSYNGGRRPAAGSPAAELCADCTSRTRCRLFCVLCFKLSQATLEVKMASWLAARQHALFHSRNGRLFPDNLAAGRSPISKKKERIKEKKTSE